MGQFVHCPFCAVRACRGVPGVAFREARVLAPQGGQTLRSAWGRPTLPQHKTIIDISISFSVDDPGPGDAKGILGQKRSENCMSTFQLSYLQAECVEFQDYSLLPDRRSFVLPVVVVSLDLGLKCRMLGRGRSIWV